MAFWVDFLFRARSAHITYSLFTVHYSLSTVHCSLFTEQKTYMYAGG